MFSCNRNGQEVKPQFKKKLFYKTQTNLLMVLLRITIFAWRTTWNYAYSPFQTSKYNSFQNKNINLPNILIESGKTFSSLEYYILSETPRISLTPPPDFAPFLLFSVELYVSIFSLPYLPLPYPPLPIPTPPYPLCFAKTDYPLPSFPNLPRDMVNIVYLIIQIKPDSIYTVCPVFYCSSSNKYSYFIPRVNLVCYS